MTKKRNNNQGESENINQSSESYPSGIGLNYNSREFWDKTYKTLTKTMNIYDENNSCNYSTSMLRVGNKDYTYICFGPNDETPYELKKLIMGNMITAQCMHTNVIFAYGNGLKFVDRQTNLPSNDKEIIDFAVHNSIYELFWEQITDVKMYNFSVMVIILSNDGEKIVQMRNKEAMYCRFEDATSTKSGEIEHVFFGDFREGQVLDDKVEVIPLLDMWDPLGDLEVRMGRKADPYTGEKRNPTKERKFAIVCRMATPGCQYYPTPYYVSMFHDNWYDIYKLIGSGKKFLIRNTSAPRIQIEVHNDYWDNLCDNEGIMEPKARADRKTEEMQNIIDFVTGVENAGKAMVSGYYVDPNGKENRMVRIYNLNNSNSVKEGGDWSDDMAEAANIICFCMGVHPNLIGATPGKSQMNNSGSDKRELATLKQSMEKAYKDIMTKPYYVMLHYNGWSDKIAVDIPMIELTTLDEKRSSKEVSQNASSNENED